MRKILSFLLCLLLCCSPACAENLTPGADPNYIHLGDLGYPLERLCRSIGVDAEFVKDDERIEPICNDSVLEALLAYQEENGLEPTGEFDPDTLRCILNTYRPECGDLLVWIPMHGGVKYHDNPGCCDMLEPRQMPVDCVMWFGYDSCGRCKPNIELRRCGWMPD